MPQRKSVDVDQLVWLFDLLAHQVDQGCPPGYVAASVERRCDGVLFALRGAIGEWNHLRPACAAWQMAETMPE